MDLVRMRLCEKRSAENLVLSVVMIMACAAIVWAQGTASVSGRAMDTTGAAIPGAKVTVKNVETGATRTTTSEETGLYRVLSLPVGHYEVRVEKDGFKTEVRSGIDLVVGQEAVVNLSLEVGELMQQVTVNAEAPLVNTTTAETSGLVGERAVKDLPLNGRSYDNLIALNAGTVNFTSMHTTSSTYTGGLGNRFSIAGRRPDENLFLLNGVEYGGNGSIATSPGSVSRQLLGIDAIREFNVVRDNYSAEYGKRAGGQISTVTMSGTNQFHGSAFEFLRNSDLDARNFFDLRNVPPFKRNNFGSSAGGPIWKDKTFIFGNYEGLRQRLGLSNVATVPDANARQGLLPNSQGQLMNVGLAPGVAPYLVLYPAPNGPEAGGGAALFFNNPKQSIREDFGTVRLDQIFSEKDSLSGVYTIDDGESLTPQVADTIQTSLTVRTQVASVTEVHVFSSNLLNTFTAGFSRATFFSQDSPLVDVPASLSFIQGAQLGQLLIGTQGGVGGGALSTVGANGAIGSPRNLFTVTDSVQITKGAHLISAGAWFNRLQENDHKGLNIGKVTFSTLQALLQGQMQLFSANPFPTPLGERSLQGAWYVQDTIKVRPNLTLNIGLRHEFTNGWNEVAGRFSNFILGPDGVLLNQPRIASSMFTKNNAKWLLGPRLGLAWDPFGNGKTAVRAGFGMYYTLLDDLAFWSSKNPPFNQAIQISNATFPFPQVTPANVSSFPGASLAPLSTQQDMQTPTVVAYNFKIEQGLGPNLSFSVGYSGLHGYHDLGLVDFNTARPTICAAALGNCPGGLSDGTKFFPPGVPRRNPRIGSAKTDSSIGSSYYNSLTLELTRRFSQGLSFRANYTWSKALDIISSPAALANQASTLLDPGNPRLDLGPAVFDLRNRFTFSGSYELPVGKGKVLGNNLGGLADKLAGHWQVNAIVNVQSGLRFDPQLGFNQSRDGDSSIPDRPSVNPNFSGPLNPGLVNRWYDPHAFILPPAGTYGNAGRNSLIGPGLATVDLSLFKNIPIAERLNLQFRAEAFNLLNRANFGLPNPLVLNPDGSARSTAGLITSTSTTSRQLQFGLRLIW